MGTWRSFARVAISIARRTQSAAKSSPLQRDDGAILPPLGGPLCPVPRNKRHPSELGQDDVVEFLSALAIRNRVSSSTQNQALAAISFLYREVLGTPLEQLDPIARAKRAIRLPVVLTKEEVRQLIARMEGTPQLVAMLLYGSGLRVLECLTLRVKDLDFASHVTKCGWQGERIGR